MPGLRLTSEQVQRLCGVERGVPTGARLARGTNSLYLKSNGVYARFTGGEESRSPVGRADLSSSQRLVRAWREPASSMRWLLRLDSNQQPSG